jgi:hypothetical protein
MMIKKPAKGVKILATKENTRKKENDFIGVVDRLEGDICHYTNKNNEHDMFIWNFKDGLNKNVYFTN